MKLKFLLSLEIKYNANLLFLIKTKKGRFWSENGRTKMMPKNGRLPAKTEGLDSLDICKIESDKTMLKSQPNINSSWTAAYNLRYVDWPKFPCNRGDALILVPSFIFQNPLIMSTFFEYHRWLKPRVWFVFCSTVALWDLRKIKNMKSKLGTVSRSRSVTSAYFSPLTGKQIVATSMDHYLT